MQELERELEKTDGLLNENGERIAIMNEHLTNVQQELKYTQSRVRHKAGTRRKGKPLQALHEHTEASGFSGCYMAQVEARNKEAETESHLQALAQREMVRKKSGWPSVLRLA